MSEPRPTDFRPRWYLEATSEERSTFHDEPWIGHQPLVYPRITTRIVPPHDDPTLSAKTLSEIVECTQKIAHYAANDVVNGLNPEFSDLRSVRRELLAFSLLSIEPFEEGSFVIPSRLEAPPIESTEEGASTATTDQVVQRFHEILKSLNSGALNASVSLGALHTVDALAHTVEKVGANLEISATDSRSKSLERIYTAADFRPRIQRMIQRRRTTYQTLQQLEGRVTSLDIEQGKLLLSTSLSSERTAGSFPMTLHPKLLESLGRHVRLFGLIDWVSDMPKSINIQDSEFLDD